MNINRQDLISGGSEVTCWAYGLQLLYTVFKSQSICWVLYNPLSMMLANLVQALFLPKLFHAQLSVACSTKK